MRTGLMLAGAAVALAAGSAAAAGGDQAAGREKSLACVSCHGALGVSEHAEWPNLAGQKRGYLVKQLAAFRDGTRADPWMSPMAQSLSDQDIADLAAYYSALPIRP